MRTLLLLSLWVFAAPAFARTGDDELSIHLGGYGSGDQLQFHGKDVVGDGGGLFGLRYLLRVDKNVWLGFEIDGMNAGEHDSTTLVNNLNTHTELKGSAALIVARVQFRETKQLRPYLLGGLGMQTSRLKLTAAPVSGKGWQDTGSTENRTLIDDKRTSLGSLFETGVDWYFSPHLAAGAFMALHAQGAEEYRTTATAKAVGLGDTKAAFGGIALGLSLIGRF